MVKVMEMNIKRILLCTFAAAAVCACQTEKLNEIVQETPEYKVSFVANVEADNSSKAVIGTNAAGKIQTFWENGDKITVYSDGNGAINKVMYPFETALASPAASAVFGYNGDAFVSGEHYLAIYPHTDGNTRDANFGETRMARVDVPLSQKLVAGGFDRSAAIMLAYSDNLNTMNFMNAVALVKFKVADENIKSGSITAKAANIAGRFRGDVKLNETGPYSTELVEYNSGTTNAPSPTLNFSVEGGAALVTGTDYYVAVRPVALEEGFSVYLDGEFIKTYYITEFKRNTIYDLGTLSLPEKEEESEDKITLTFDFTTNANFIAAGNGYSAWPTSDKWNSSAGEDIECGYTLDGVNYGFRLADCPNGTNARIYWNSKGYLTLGNASRYVGIPALDGYKLTKVVCLHATTANTKNGRGLAITSNIVESTATPTYVSGGEPQITKSTGDNITFNLDGTSAGTRYYIMCSLTGIGVSKITLVYEKDGSTPANSVRIGTYNLRYINSTDAEENQWENRKGRVKQSILDNEFDVFAVQECSDGIKTYLESELSSVYSGKYFNAYAGHSSKVEHIALLYKKDKFTLSDWKTFWLADDISKIGSISAPNDASGEHTYYRGGCCAVLTEKATNKKMFVISTHGCLGAEYRAKYAAIYAEVEKMYNPNGYPAFLLGDMNARPTDAASVEYRKYWNDVYRTVAQDKIIGPFATYNGFVLDRDLNADPKRLDYIYYRNATPLNYVCNNKKYDSLYASDHLPVYADMVIK